MGTREGTRGEHPKRALLSSLPCGESLRGPSPASDREALDAVSSAVPLQRTALIRELIVLTLTCFNRSKVSINHFLVALLITALC